MEREGGGHGGDASWLAPGRRRRHDEAQSRRYGDFCVTGSGETSG
jgi:hypothetical protein